MSETGSDCSTNGPYIRRELCPLKALKNEIRCILFHIRKHKRAVEKLLDDPSVTAEYNSALYEARWNLDYALDRFRVLAPMDGSPSRIYMKRPGGILKEMTEIVDPECKRYIRTDLYRNAASSGLDLEPDGLKSIEALLGPDWDRESKDSPVTAEEASASSEAGGVPAETAATSFQTVVQAEVKFTYTPHLSTASIWPGGSMAMDIRWPPCPKRSAAPPPPKRAKTAGTAAAWPATWFPPPPPQHQAPRPCTYNSAGWHAAGQVLADGSRPMFFW